MSDSEYWSDFIDGFEPPSAGLEKKRKPEEQKQQQSQKRPKGNKNTGLKKKSSTTSNQGQKHQKRNNNSTTIFRLGHVSKQKTLGIEQDIYADGFVMTYTTKSSFQGTTKLVFHITFSKKGNPVCFFVINYKDTVTDKWLWYKKSDVKKKTTTLTLKNGEKINVNDFEKIDIETDLKRPPEFRTKKNKNKKQFAQFEDLRQNKWPNISQYRIGYEKAENATNFLKTYKSFIPSVDNMPQILGLLVLKGDRKPKNMMALDAYINNITIKRRILSHDEEFKNKIKTERDVLKTRNYPLES